MYEVCNECTPRAHAHRHRTHTHTIHDPTSITVSYTGVRYGWKNPGISEGDCFGGNEALAEFPPKQASWGYSGIFPSVPSWARVWYFFLHTNQSILHVTLFTGVWIFFICFKTWILSLIDKMTYGAKTCYDDVIVVFSLVNLTLSCKRLLCDRKWPLEPRPHKLFKSLKVVLNINGED